MYNQDAPSSAKLNEPRSDKAISSRIESLHDINKHLGGLVNDAEGLAMFAAGGAPLVPPTAPGSAAVAPVPNGMVEQIDQVVFSIRSHLDRLEAAHNRARQALS